MEVSDGTSVRNECDISSVILAFKIAEDHTVKLPIARSSEELPHFFDSIFSGAHARVPVHTSADCGKRYALQVLLDGLFQTTSVTGSKQGSGIFLVIVDRAHSVDDILAR